MLLALALAVRPTSVAAIYALLASARPRRGLLLFLVAGFGFSFSVGVLVVSALHGFDGVGRPTANDVLDVAIGAAALGFAAGIASGRMAPRRRAEREAPSPWMARLRDPTAGVLVVAGIATHLPGLFYLAGLNAIVSSEPGFARGVAEVLVFNGLWYSTGVAALLAFIARPHATLDAVGAVRAWLSARQRTLLVAVFGVVGAYLLVIGVSDLAG